MNTEYKIYSKRSMVYSILTDMLKVIKDIFSKKKVVKKKNNKKFY
ncbi:hypothetical protein N6H18_11135 [Reichenbachiella agarivorans]|uniref:Uncharacterized protein n=1 Tax=Reichenbachiella agarivorans TaxID=2979464 RepID=A0ABY6CKI4_9BACT|nr:hypothetical protein [Reichenbachiella agarivorans]UXP30904.1 hypothetical protein N6H18_11135 [Reichenbachiella agarivorans]